MRYFFAIPKLDKRVRLELVGVIEFIIQCASLCHMPNFVPLKAQPKLTFIKISFSRN